MIPEQSSRPTSEADALLACPACRSVDIDIGGDRIRCKACTASYIVRDGIPIFLRDSANVYETDPDRAEFWDEGWEKRFGALLGQGDNEIVAFRDDFRTMLEKQKYPAVTEIGARSAGRVLLNIGCGGGQEGLLFAGYGARYIGVDFSYNAARYTEKLIRRLNYTGSCYQAEAERLPFRDASMDLIYTNGVLHHTPNTPDTLREVCRVLSRDGEAFIGLYATHSVAFYWYRFRAILAGNFTPSSIERWLDASTEGEWQTNDRQNQYTRTYTRRSFEAMLRAAGFRTIRMVQSQIQFKDLPVLGHLFRLLPASIGNACIGPFGMMLIAICRK